MPAGRAGAEAPSGSLARSTGALIGLGLLGLVCVVVLLGLGTWQIERRAWKLDLIARVEARIHATATAAPAPASWPDVTAARDEYRHVAVSGTFLNDRDALVQAVTDYGPGFWLMTPLRTEAGWTVLINRGFVPPDRRDPLIRRADAVEGPVTLTGLLRLPEPGGAFLRRNDPAGDRWFSRDVAAIAAARDLGPVAPYFIDADGPPDPTHPPLGGLTVVRFPNNHLVYALTWYGLALMLIGALVVVGRSEWRQRRIRPGAR